jgi:hypothetical protein
LLAGLLHAFESVVGSGDGRLHQRDGVLGAGGRVLDGVVDDRHELRLRIGSGRFGDTADFGAGRGGDFIHQAAIGGGLLGGGLDQAGLQGQQLLRVLDRQGGLDRRRSFGQGGLGDLGVQLDQLLDAFEGEAGKAEEVSTLACGRNDLVSGHHEGSPGVMGGSGSVSDLCCSATRTKYRGKPEHCKRFMLRRTTLVGNPYIPARRVAGRAGGCR